MLHAEIAKPGKLRSIAEKVQTYARTGAFAKCAVNACGCGQYEVFWTFGLLVLTHAKRCGKVFLPLVLHCDGKEPEDDDLFL